MEGSTEKSEELPFQISKKSELGPERARNRRLEIVEKYVKKLGLGNARTFTREISKKYEIGERQVRKDFQWIIGNYKPEDIRQAKLDIRILRDKTLSLALLNIESASNPQDRNEAIKTAWLVIEKYRQDMEEWGEKEKVAEKHEITQKTLKLSFVRHDGTPISSRSKNTIIET
jgi:hypothetical protein